MKKQHFLTLLLLAAAFVSCTNDTEPYLTDDTGTMYTAPQQVALPYADISSDVTEEEAQNVAAQFAGAVPTLQSTRSISSKPCTITPVTNAGGDILMYIVSYGKGNGYAVVSGTKKCPSILAYSETGDFDATKGGQSEWLENAKASISQRIADGQAKWNIDWMPYEESLLKPGQETTAYSAGYSLGWWRHQTMTEEQNKNLPSTSNIFLNTYCSLNDLSRYVSVSDTYFSYLISETEALGYQKTDIFAHVVVYDKNASMGPLLTTSWHQKSPYIDYAKEGALGCTTVAIGQLMYYYKQPAGYNWSAIGRTGSTEQQAFLKEIGKRIGFDYSEYLEERSAPTEDMIRVLKSYNYAISTSDKTNYSSMVSSIVSTGPFIARGTRADGKGHAWVIDGYQDKGQYIYVYIYAPTGRKPSNNMFTENPYQYQSGYNIQDSTTKYYFHMNWGWEGNYNSWNIAGDFTPKGKSYTFDAKNFYIFKK